jgi:hypothetical protein
MLKHWRGNCQYRLVWTAAAYNAGSFGLLAGLMYWAHKTEHHKLERILHFAVGGWEGLLSARNYRVIANRAR